MQFYRPLWPQHRLSSSLLNKHEYDFSPILAELPKDSKVASKIMNFAVNITKDLMQEKVDLMEKKEHEKLDLTKNLMEKKEREKLDLTKDLEREKLDLTKDLMQEKVELSNHITNLKNDVKHRTELLLRSKRMCNVRGALEFIRSTDKTISFREPTDNVLTRLTQDAKFISYLKQACLLNNSQYKDVERCMGGLYHTASKKLHGHDKDIEIDARDWSVNEVLALDELHLSAFNDDDRSINPDGTYVKNLYNQFRIAQLGDRNGKGMFDRMQEIVTLYYNNSGKGKAILQTYNSSTTTPFILCIVTNLMKRVHEKIRQAGELCYFDASAAFDPPNTSITLLYTSAFLTSDETEITIESAINLLKIVLPDNAFYNCGSQIGPMIITTDDSYAEHNAIAHCWPTYDHTQIMTLFKKGLYAPTIDEMEIEFSNLRHKYFTKYDQLAAYCLRLWERRATWALALSKSLILCGNHTNNYVKRTIANRHLGHLEISTRFRCPGWEGINQENIQYDNINNIYFVPSATINNKYYIVDSSIGTCTCPMALGGSPCKHQAVVAIKYHSGSFNYIAALTLEDYPTFYASLRAPIVSAFGHKSSKCESA
ncbi:19316_t:CDS:2 [Gigaspora margarita]|uniref:19316_t:CDS:1 n=1 Tax=Gigaspora margarita TaxID=4874 RepID=A0ABN7UNW9_GIGMA|nr:19316_t:CDS:2 [Gigaspora margarita]